MNTHTVTDTEIIHALSYPNSNIFITTTLYWECECESNYIRPFDMDYCENCDTFRSDSPDSRINELKRHNIHVNYSDDNVRRTLQLHHDPVAWATSP